MALTGIKLDDGTSSFPSNCFPVRSLRRQTEEDGGAWLVAHQANEKRRFKAVLCAKPRDFHRIRAERKKAEKEGTHIVPPPTEEPEEEGDDGRMLDGFFLMKHCCVEDPADLCSVNLTGEQFSEVKAEDFQLFDNVAYVNAAENFLPVGCFRHFPIIRELEMPLNGLRNLKLSLGDYPHLEMLDLSYNNLSPEDLLVLGLLPSLRVLHLTGNGLNTLPAEMARPFQPENMEKKILRFSRLEVLMLDDNHLSDLTTFATLAGLSKLQHLSLSQNDIHSVPHLMLNDETHFTQDTTRTPSPGKAKRSSRRSARRAKHASHKVHSPKKRQHSDESLPRNQSAEMPNEDFESKTWTIPEVPPTTEKTHPSQPDPLEENAEFDDMKLEELNLGALDEKIQDDIRREHALSNNVYSGAYAEEQTADGMPPPFPELRHLNLSHNKVTEEEGLLALAAWPMLCELLIHDNPLTTQTSGDPPLLKRFLRDRLGISIYRKKPASPKKPHIEVAQRPSRKVKTTVPHVPRCNVDELLALEAPPSHPAASIKSSLDPSKPLPPIPGTPVDVQSDEEERKPEQYDGAAFFMTQVDEPESKARPPAEQRQRRKKKTKKREVAAKYKGYEEILDIDESEVNDDEVPMPKDIQGNIRALKYTLDHPLVFRDNNVDLEQPQEPFRPYIRRKGMTGMPASTRQEKVAKVLDDVKNRETVIEEPLEEVLNKCQAERRGTYHEAKRLLAELKNSFGGGGADSSDDDDEDNPFSYARLFSMHAATHASQQVPPQ